MACNTFPKRRDGALLPMIGIRVGTGEIGDVVVSKVEDDNVWFEWGDAFLESGGGLELIKTGHTCVDDFDRLLLGQQFGFELPRRLIAVADEIAEDR